MKPVHFLIPVSYFLTAGSALAHGSSDGFVLLLPTRYYILGAAFAVATSFLLLGFLPERAAIRLMSMRQRLLLLPERPFSVFSLLSVALFASLVWYGHTGPSDPFQNPLPLFIWIVFWIVFALLQAVTGELWSLLNPWSGILWLLRRKPQAGLARLPSQVGYGIAIAQFLIFAWIELADTSSYDPGYLAICAFTYWIFNFSGMFIFGELEWGRRAEPFSIFFSFLGALSPFLRQRSENEKAQLYFSWPGWSLVKGATLPLSGGVFVLITLSTVSFDGFSNTFRWASLIGMNPLDFPGRSAVVAEMTIGILCAAFILSGLFFACIWGGLKLIGEEKRLIEVSGRLVYSIIPISIAFHLAHYLTYVMVEGQYALKLASDPFGRGWNLFGTADLQVTTSFFYNYESVLTIWNIQTAVIVLGHVAGITIAHLTALDIFPGNNRAASSQIFLAILMVFYTAFGLWLLASPKIT